MSGLRREVAEGERWRKARAAGGRARLKETACGGRVVEPRVVMLAFGGDGERGPVMRTGGDAPAVVRAAPWRRQAVELHEGVIALASLEHVAPEGDRTAVRREIERDATALAGVIFELSIGCEARAAVCRHGVIPRGTLILLAALNY